MWTLHQVRAAHRSADVDATLTVLDRAKGRLLLRWLNCDDGSGDALHSHIVQVSTVGDFEAPGTDMALDAIETFVRDHPDNLRKLAASRVEVRHLFICLDAESSAGVSHAVSRRYVPPPVDGGDYFGLPTRPPSLPVEVDELWVVYELDGEGWHWGEERWEQLGVRR